MAFSTRRAASPGAKVQHAAEELQVLPATELRIEGVLLRHRRDRGRACAGVPDAPALRPAQPGQQVDERRLARAVRAQQAHGLPAREPQVDAAQRRLVLPRIAVFELLGGQDQAIVIHCEDISGVMCPAPQAATDAGTRRPGSTVAGCRLRHSPSGAMPYRSRRPGDHHHDLCDVQHRAEVAAARVGRIAPGDRHRQGRVTLPGGLISISLSKVNRLPCTVPRSAMRMTLARVHAKAGLRIGDGMPRRPGNPEAGEAIGPIACRRKLRAVVQARADHDALGVALPCREQARRVGGIVLPVAVQRDHARAHAGSAHSGTRCASWRLCPGSADAPAASPASRRSCAAVPSLDPSSTTMTCGQCASASCGQLADRARLLVGGDRDPHAVPGQGRLLFSCLHGQYSPPLTPMTWPVM